MTTRFMRVGDAWHAADCDSGPGRWGPRRITEFVSMRSNGLGIAAEEGDCLVGFALYRCDRDAGRLLLDRLAVHPQWRHVGVGREILGALAVRLEKVRLSRVVATVHERDDDATGFLRACGWRARLARGAFDDADGYAFEFAPTAAVAVVDQAVS